MVHAVHRLLAGGVVAALLWWPGGATAQGVIVPSPGSSSAATGPNSINPSAAASDTRNPNAMNRSAAPSAVTSPNALNPNATPSTFAPNISAPNALTPMRRQGAAVWPPPRTGGSGRPAGARPEPPLRGVGHRHLGRRSEVRPAASPPGTCAGRAASWVPCAVGAEELSAGPSRKPPQGALRRGRLGESESFAF
jgi:hypothetical protein